MYLITSLLVFISVFWLGSTLQCHVCSSATEITCSATHEYNCRVANTEQFTPYCIRIKGLAYDNETYFESKQCHTAKKESTKQEICDDISYIDGKVTECEACTSDLCNTGSSINISVIVVAAIAVFSIAIY